MNEINGEIFVVKIFRVLNFRGKNFPRLKFSSLLTFVGQAKWQFVLALITRRGLIFARLIFVGQATYENLFLTEISPSTISGNV